MLIDSRRISIRSIDFERVWSSATVEASRLFYRHTISINLRDKMIRALALISTKHMIFHVLIGDSS